jgi:hypothetical protein
VLCDEIARLAQKFGCVSTMCGERAGRVGTTTMSSAWRNATNLNIHVAVVGAEVVAESIFNRLEWRGAASTRAGDDKNVRASCGTPFLYIPDRSNA